MSTPAERIGIVLVHGIGEQRRFEHLSLEMTQLIATLESMGLDVSVQPNTTQDAALHAEQETWHAENAAPLRVDIRAGNGRLSLLVHEVWWADLDDKVTLWNQVKFWFWGLGMWGVRRYVEPAVPGAKQMLLPKSSVWPQRLEWLRAIIVRLRLYAFALVFFLSLGSLSLLNYVLGRLRLGQLPGGSILYQYVGDVKLYQDRRQHGAGAITDVNGPRRFAIRRRMVRTLVDAARADYDRWYVLAHSLGTVVAWNGLMETAHCLPNYLGETLWQSLTTGAQPLGGPRLDGKQEPTDRMWPPRPVWLDESAVIYRERLFAKLRGLVTYGSPLDKFAYLWPRIVPINPDNQVWRNDFEWLNVFDHTDPVGSALFSYQESTPGGGPQNHAYHASPVLLLSHVKYLAAKPPRDALGQRVLEWMLAGNTPFKPPAPADRSWYRSPHPVWGFVLRLPMWLLAAVLMALVLAYWAVPTLLGLGEWMFAAAAAATKNIGPALSAWLDDVHDTLAAAIRLVQDTEPWLRAVWVAAAASVGVFIAGVVRRMVEWRMDRGPPRKTAV